MTLDQIIANLISSLIWLLLVAGVGWLFRQRLMKWLLALQDRRHFEQLGLAGIEEFWYDLITFTGRHGREFKERLNQTKSATWYFITHDPHGFAPWLGRSSEPSSVAYRVEHHDLEIVWVYHQTEAYEEQRLLLTVNAPDDSMPRYAVGVEMLHMARKNRPSKWSIFMSSKAHFYLAFLSVPRNVPASEGRAPVGSFGFVVPYLMTRRAYVEQPALYLVAPDSTRKPQYLLDYYYNSVLDYIRVGQEQRWLVPDLHPIGAQ